MLDSLIPFSGPVYPGAPYTVPPTLPMQPPVGRRHRHMMRSVQHATAPGSPGAAPAHSRNLSPFPAAFLLLPRFASGSLRGGGRGRPGRLCPVDRWLGAMILAVCAVLRGRASCRSSSPPHDAIRPARNRAGLARRGAGPQQEPLPPSPPPRRARQARRRLLARGLRAFPASRFGRGRPSVSAQLG